MEKPDNIPVSPLEEVTTFHSRTFDWKPFLTNTKHSYFHINRLETFVHEITFPSPPHRKPIFDFIYQRKGYSKRSKGLTMYEFGDSSIFFLPAYQITQHEIMTVETEGFFCHFDDQLFHYLPKNFLSDNYTFFQFQANPVVKLTATAMRNVEALLERLLELYKKEGIDKSIIATYLLTLFEEVKIALPCQAKKTKNAFFQITEQYKHALVNHIYQKQTVADYADFLNISPNYLNKCVINSINKTAQDLLNEMLILEAKTLLKYTDLQIAEIAVKLRNQTPSNFARFFKIQTGITPKEYLEMY
jgi:AraC family transcriptional regulator, transcriptional activator of pobA